MTSQGLGNVMSEVGVESLQETKVRWDCRQPLLSSAVLGCTTSVQGQSSQYSSMREERVSQSQNPEYVGAFVCLFYFIFLCIPG